MAVYFSNYNVMKISTLSHFYLWFLLFIFTLFINFSKLNLNTSLSPAHCLGGTKKEDLAKARNFVSQLLPPPHSYELNFIAFLCAKQKGAMPWVNFDVGSEERPLEWFFNEQVKKGFIVLLYYQSNYPVLINIGWITFLVWIFGLGPLLSHPRL